MIHKGVQFVKRLDTRFFFITAAQHDAGRPVPVGHIGQVFRGQVRIDPGAHKVAVATIGPVDLHAFEARLAETIAAVEAQLAAGAIKAAPAGYSLRRDGAATASSRPAAKTRTSTAN